jgi:hypothetical protein
LSQEFTLKQPSKLSSFAKGKRAPCFKKTTIDFERNFTNLSSMQNEVHDSMKDLSIPDFNCAQVDEQDSNVGGGRASSTTLTNDLHVLP